MKRIIKIVSTIIIIGIVWMIDLQDRYSTKLSHYFSEEEATFFMYYKTAEESQEVIKANWDKKEYQFPREILKSIRYYKNIPFFSRLMSKKLAKEQEVKLIEIINDPGNFHWGETTWAIKESSCFFRFFNEENKEIGKLWVCYDGCGMTELRPWVPATKYGGFSEKGKLEFIELINGI
ncbi:MAG: hypothetical protein MI974_10160 [Chitinophagales bacterium]|nr:hypothetical protein [Chitinophagales bacterium]